MTNDPFNARTNTESEKWKGSKEVEKNRRFFYQSDGPTSRDATTPAAVRGERGRWTASDQDARFWAKVTTGEAGCWLWTGRLNADGYGRYTAPDGREVRAHRHAWELVVGPIPAGLTLDHLCNQRRCVNPAHLEPVTAGENVRRRHARRRAGHDTGHDTGHGQGHDAGHGAEEDRR